MFARNFVVFLILFNFSFAFNDYNGKIAKPPSQAALDILFETKEKIDTCNL